MIILTGASGGIGQAILPYLAVFDDVIAIYNTKKPNLAGLNNVTAVKLDLTSELEINNFVISFKDKLKLVTLIHAAALKIDNLAVNFNVKDWDKMMHINLRGNFLLTKALLMNMMTQEWGRIVHFSSVAGYSAAAAGNIAYSTSKTALLGLSKVIATEYAKFGITSNVLVLGYFNLGMHEKLNEKLQEKLKKSIPSGKFGEPKNISNAIKFLIDSEFVNGSVVHIDGGI